VIGTVPTAAEFSRASVPALTLITAATLAEVRLVALLAPEIIQRPEPVLVMTSAPPLVLMVLIRLFPVLLPVRVKVVGRVFALELVSPPVKLRVALGVEELLLNV
jgi:hypothetical protein